MSGIIPDDAAVEAMKATHIGQNPDATIKDGAKFPRLGPDGDEEEEE